MNSSLAAHDKPVANELGWQVARVEYPFATPWLTLRRDAIFTDGGENFTYTYVQASPAVFIVPVTSDGEIVLIRQYRYPVDDWVLGIPAGGTFDRADQDLIEVARAELREEAGGVSPKIREVATFYPWGSRADQVTHVYMALDVDLSASQKLDEMERIEIMRVPAEEALDMARRGEIKDAESALCLFLCEGLLRELGFIPGSIG